MAGACGFLSTACMALLDGNTTADAFIPVPAADLVVPVGAHDFRRRDTSSQTGYIYNKNNRHLRLEKPEG